ncbi:MAG: divalent-cation tolerance protein CutA [Wenzhouxiangellaceae bacterium]|nr:divalent-cation tolerance protein CutA [Wenzhouxiangellaceae bacterium]
MQSEPLLLIQTTCENEDEAERLARTLVEERLAACASLGAGVRSVYPWKGSIETAAEVPLALKTTPEAFPALRARLVELHSYDVPEVLALPVTGGLDEYIDWARDWIRPGVGR